MDCVVRSWLHGTISAELAEAVMGRGGSARAAWLAIEAQFLGNRKTRALHLDARFRHFCQGDLSITDYCRKFKSMADDLADLGEPVTDRTLVLNVIRSLNKNFNDIGRHLRRGRPFPTFLDVCNDLLLEEITAAQRHSAALTALLAAGAGGASSGSPAPRSSAPQQPPSKARGGSGSGSGGATGGGRNRRSKRAGRSDSKRGTSGGGDSSASSSAGQAAGGAPAAGQWPSFYNPWTGSIQMWPGPRPPLPQAAARPAPQQALLAQQQGAPPPAPAPFVAPAQPPAPWAAAGPGVFSPVPQWGAPNPWAGLPGIYNTTGQPSWDQQSLASTFSTMTLNQPQQTEWYFDSGATSHMVSDSRSLSHIFPQRYPFPSAIVVGDGSLLPVTSTGSAHLSGPLHLNNILVSPKFIKNLISVRQFTSDNNCSVEFDPSGCCVKDLGTRNVIVRCNSSGPLYPLHLLAAATALAAGSTFHLMAPPPWSSWS